RQVGVSESSVTEVLWCMDTADSSRTLVYTLPSTKLVEDFSNTRYKAAIEESPYLKARELEAMKAGWAVNVGLKHLGLCDLFFRSGAVARFGEGIPADVVFFDELDGMSPAIKPAFQEALSASPLGWERNISTPTIPNYGVDRVFQRSDQKAWFVPCGACGRLQELTYPDGIVDVGRDDEGEPLHDFICLHCRTVGRLDRTRGQWVAKSPSRSPRHDLRTGRWEGDTHRGFTSRSLSVPGSPRPRSCGRSRTRRRTRSSSCSGTMCSACPSRATTSCSRRRSSRRASTARENPGRAKCLARARWPPAWTGAMSPGSSSAKNSARSCWSCTRSASPRTTPTPRSGGWPN
ncbi:MAG: phage terminase large subunit family protein, partial [Armatimonadetes bacterium]|nr:phage terminase large subunit family protein [Armatimonadota bacterium]